MLIIIFVIFSIIAISFVKLKKENLKNNNQVLKSKNNINPAKEGYVIFLNWANRKEILDQNEYPQYFYYDYGIINCSQFHIQLIKEGYLEKASLKTYLSTKTIEELKNILKENNLKKIWKKSELIDRILENINLENIKRENGYYELTNKGINFLKENEYIIKLRKLNIPLAEYETVKKELNSNFLFDDIVWGIYNKRILNFYLDKDFGLYRNTLLEMSIFFKSKNNLQKELEYLLKVTYLDLSGNSNNGTIDNKKLLFIPLAKRIFNLKEYYLPEQTEKCYEIKLPFHYCTKKIFYDIIQEILEGKTEEEILKKYLPRMKKEPK